MIHHIKYFLGKFPFIYVLISVFYHELNYYFSKVVLMILYPRLKVIRFTRKDIDLQRSQGFYSQFGQDYYVVTNFFTGVTEGIFLDVGCNEPFYNNNTAYLEQSLLWSGVACDPVSYHEHAWRSGRSVDFLPIALGTVDGEREFVEIDNADGWSSMMSSFLDTVRAEDLQKGYKKYKVRVRSGNNVLKQFGIGRLDFLSIDVEGAELDVLGGLDLIVLAPQVILVENTRGLIGDRHLRSYLRKSGYYFHSRIWTCDDIFVRIQ